MSTLLFRNVRVYPGHGDSLLAAQDVAIDGTVISAVLPHDAAAPPSDDAVMTIDGQGRTLMPGLIDAHWHAAFTSVSAFEALTADPYYLMLVAGQQATATLLRGFTTVRDCRRPHLRAEAGDRRGLVDGPRIFPSGAFISQTSGHGDYRSHYELPRDPSAVTIPTARSSAPR